MKRITIGAGTKFAGNGHLLTELERQEARKDIIECADRLYGGVTFTDTYGAWRSEKTGLVIESGWSIVVYTEHAGTARKFAEFVKGCLHQEAVFLVVEDIGAELV